MIICVLLCLKNRKVLSSPRARFQERSSAVMFLCKNKTSSKDKMLENKVKVNEGQQTYQL